MAANSGAAPRKTTADRSRPRAPKDRWEAKWIGVVRSYPLSPEAFEVRRQNGFKTSAAQREAGYMPTRKGVPDGWGGRKEEQRKLKEKAKKMARKTLGKLIEEGAITEDSANEAILVALEIINDESESTGDRLKAIKIVTDCLKAKPTQKVDATITPAEAWLASLSATK